MNGDSRPSHGRTCIVLCVFAVSCGVGIGCKPSNPTSPKTATKTTTKTSKTKTSQTDLQPPVETKPVIKPGQLPFKWSEAPTPSYQDKQIVLYVPHGYYEEQFEQEHVHLNYRPGRVSKFDKQFAHIKPLTKADAPSQALPHALVIALPPRVTVSPGDVVLTWSRTKYPYLQRAQVITGGHAPKVHMLDLAINETYLAIQTLDEGTFLPIDMTQPHHPGRTVSWQDNEIERHGIVLAKASKHILVRGFGEEVFALSPERVKAIEHAKTAKVGEGVQVPFMNQYIAAKITALTQTHMTVSVPSRGNMSLIVPRIDAFK